MSCFTTGGPGKEHRANKPPPTRRVRERSKGDTICATTFQNPSLWHPSWLNMACTNRKDSESEWFAKGNPETNPITIKPETASHLTELFWVLLPYCSPPRCPFPIKSLALSAHVSPRTIHFWVLDKSPVSGPGRASPFLQHNHLILCHPLSYCLQSFPASGSFQMSQFFPSGSQSIGISASALVLPMNTQDWFPLGWTGWISLLSKGLSRVFSNTTVQKHEFFNTQLSSWSNSHIHTWLLEKP